MDNPLWSEPCLSHILRQGDRLKALLDAMEDSQDFQVGVAVFGGFWWSQVPLKRGPGHQVLGFFFAWDFFESVRVQKLQKRILDCQFWFWSFVPFFWNQGWWKICLNSNKTTLYVIMLFSFQDRVFDTNPVISIDPERWKCRIRRIRGMPDIVASTFALSQRSFPRKFPRRNLVIEASLEILNSSVIWGPVPLGLHPISAGDRSLPHHGNEGAASFFGGRTVAGWWSNLHILKHCNGINGTL